MEELEYFFFDNLYTAKCMWDSGLGERFLENCGSLPVNSDDFFELYFSSVGSVFEVTRNYYDEEAEIDILVFFDSMFDEYFKLCTLYEKKTGVSPENNNFRKPVQQAVCNSFGFVDYSADWWLYDDAHGRARLVVLTGIEFGSHHALAGGLACARAEMTYRLEELKKTLAKLGSASVVAFPKTAELKEAA